MMDLWTEITETLELLDTALAEAKRRGQAMVEAEAAYYTAKDTEAFRLKDMGEPVTFIQTVIKGQPGVVEKLEAYHRAQVEYENAREARNCYKKRLDTLREEYSREWGRVSEE